MIKNKSKLVIPLLIFTMCLTVLAPVAFAQETPSIELPVRINLDGLDPAEGQEFVIILEADNSDYPMPVGSVNGIYRMVIQDETSSLPQIIFSEIGIYTYSIYQEADEDEFEEFDERIYNLVVYVTLAEDGDGLEVMVILYALGESEKFEEIVFSNVYQEPEEEEPEEKPIVPQTSDDTVILPYVGLFLSGFGILTILGFTMKKKKEH